MSKILFLFLVGLFVLIYTFLYSVTIHKVQDLKNRIQSVFHYEFEISPLSEHEKTVILIWTPYFGSTAPVLIWTRSVYCDPQCVFITDRNAFNFSDAVLFHSRDLSKAKEKSVPSIHPQHQVWVYMQQESPELTPENLHLYSNTFNWTMTYRRDSDIHHPYGLILPKNAPISQTSHESESNDYTVLLHKKKGIVAWIVSNCKTSSNREEYVTQLKQYISVDIYGRCGTLNCSRTGDGCFPEVAESYKFYLSFENAICVDYITEKLFNPLKYNIVPVVYGGGNYILNAPPHSYIDAADFQSPKELADYLRYLDSNVNEYLKYFDWKSNFYVDPSHGWCALCDKVKKHKEFPEYKVYNDLWDWWFTFEYEDSSLKEQLKTANNMQKMKACSDSKKLFYVP